MDEDRRIRFLIAPLLFISSLLWAGARNPQVDVASILPGIKLSQLCPSNVSSIIALVGGGVLIVFTLGIVIGTSSYVCVRTLFFVWSRFFGGSVCHEVFLGNQCLNMVWHLLGMEGQPEHIKDEFLAGVTFDHDFLQRKHKGVHRWLVRRWNAFSVAITSFFGLLLSLLVGWLLGLDVVPEWWVPVLFICLILLSSAIMAWHDTMAMLCFQARRARSRDERSRP